ncbi:class I SAM-dependent methyltransferase [Acetobacterium sp.]|uniref:class I SAM-dependent methyltransferase n=1 Tax=Acetobacterium sp. TaxID=1872094 RepID=UPI002F426D15
MKKEFLNNQNIHWEDTFSSKPQMFGSKPSVAAIKAVEIFKQNGVKKIIELGGGQGRDTMYFAENGFEVTVVDYTSSGIQAIKETALSMNLSYLIIPIQHDLRNPLPFENESFDACYSHMLYCMAFTTKELEYISLETARILKPEGINIYTVRNTDDADYKTGLHHGEDLYECGKFIVHFFSREKVGELAGPFDILSIDEFEEGGLPRRLFFVALRKKHA